ncbi:MAG: YjgN family protein [Candidatus Binatia bacterium]
MLVYKPVRRFRCDGETEDLFRIFLPNVLLNILTLGLYRFWGKTRIRQYMWSQSSFDREQFEYTGRGSELFRGFLWALAVTGGLIAVARGSSFWLFVVDPQLERMIRVVVTYILYILIGVGTYSARRYLLSRTRWRGIRFAQTGSAFGYAKAKVSLQGMSALTLGLYIPFMRHHLASYKLNNTWFGSEQLVYDGEGRDLLKPFLWAYLLFLPTLGLSWFWYRATEYRYIAEHIRLQDVRFCTTISGSELLRLTLGNWVLLIATLGLAYPLTLMRKARVLSQHLRIDGEFNYALITQNAYEAPVTGEGLVGVFGLGSI